MAIRSVSRLGGRSPPSRSRTCTAKWGSARSWRRTGDDRWGADGNAIAACPWRPARCGPPSGLRFGASLGAAAPWWTAWASPLAIRSKRSWPRWFCGVCAVSIRRSVGSRCRRLRPDRGGAHGRRRHDRVAALTVAGVSQEQFLALWFDGGSARPGRFRRGTGILTVARTAPGCPESTGLARRRSWRHRFPDAVVLARWSFPSRTASRRVRVFPSLRRRGALGQPGTASWC